MYCRGGSALPLATETRKRDRQKKTQTGSQGPRRVVVGAKSCDNRKRQQPGRTACDLGGKKVKTREKKRQRW